MYCISCYCQAKEGELLQLRNRTAVMKVVSDKATQNVQLVSEKETQNVQLVADKATQNVLMEKKEDLQEEVVKEEKEEDKRIKSDEIIYVKNMRRSARAARRAIVKVDQVEIF